MTTDTETHTDATIEAAYRQALDVHISLTRLQTIELYRRSNRRTAVSLHNQGYDVSFALCNPDNHARSLPDDKSTRRSTDQLARRGRPLEARRSRLFVWPEVGAIVLLSVVAGFVLGGLLIR